MASKTFWLSYDLGLKGDYSNLYTWLDNQKARECGNGLALFKFECTAIDYPEKEVLESLNATVSFSRSDRLYLVWMDSQERKLRGKFIVGQRRTSPWEGYGTMQEPTLDVLDE